MPTRPRCTARTGKWTAKQDGKTVTRRLTPAQAALYQQWIDNDRQLHAIITQMRQIADQATQTILDTHHKV